MAELEEEFTGMIQANEAMIRRICRFYAQDPEDLKDLMQEVVYQAWKSFPRFRHDSAMGTWLYRVALHTAISHRKKSRKHMPLSGSELMEPDQYRDMEDHQLLLTMILELPPLEKALVLLYLDGNSYMEIAAILGISLSNVGTKLGRIRDKLRNRAAAVQQIKK